MGIRERRRSCSKEAPPFAAMFAVECTNVGLSTIFKAATLKGLSYHVFMVYSYALSSLVLLPLCFIFYRMEVLELNKLRSQLKSVGTLITIAGAFVVVLYKGPVLINTRPDSLSSSTRLLSAAAPDTNYLRSSNWVIGGGLLAANYLIVSVWYIFQANAVNEYPAEMVVVFFYNLFSCIIATPVCFITESNLSAWMILKPPDVRLFSCLYLGIIGSGFGTTVHTWGLHVKGPVYVALFRPLSIAIAAT